MSENPWRNQGDYQQEQREARERHAMLQKEHSELLKSFRVNYLLVFATCVAATATLYSALIARTAFELQQEQASVQSKAISAKTAATP